MTSGVEWPADPPARRTDRELPPYRHLPGVTPHPIRHPDGHGTRSSGVVAEDSVEEALQAVPYGVDLYNRGYWWEAHEVWEGAWLRRGRTGPEAEFLRGLIQLAAAHLKIRLERYRGARRLARQGLERIRSAPEGGASLGFSATAVDSEATAYFGSFLNGGSPPRAGSGFPYLLPLNT